MIKPHWIIIFTILLTATSCNDDIFTDRTTPTQNEITIDGDGGSHTIKIQTKGLQWIGIDTYGGNPGITCYDKTGNIIPPESPASETARINLTSPLAIFDIYINGNKLTFHSTENVTNQSNHIAITLEYEHTLEFINVYASPGTPQQLSEFEYAMEQISVDNNAKTDISANTYTNKGGMPMRAELRPYIGQQAWVELEPEYSFANYINISVPLPTHSDGKWILSDEKQIMTASKRYYMPDAVDRMFKVPIEVPPYSTITATCRITYSKAVVPFKMTIINPVSGRQFTTRGTCTATEPVNYDISLQNTK